MDGPERYRPCRSGSPCNSQLGRVELDRFCALDEDCQKLMRGAFDRLGLTARSYDRILRVARTIADLERSETIQPHTWPRPCSSAHRSTCGGEVKPGCSPDYLEIYGGIYHEIKKSHAGGEGH